MADALPISSSGYSRAEVRRAAETLLKGGLIALPGETGYMVAASPVDEAAATRAATLMRAGGMLLVSGDQQARDYVPSGSWPESAERLARRCWPGPVVLAVETTPQRTLFGELPAVTRSLVADGDAVRLACSGHAFTRDVAAELPWPLLVCREIDEGAVGIETAETLQHRLGNELDLIVDAGPPRYPDPATVVRCQGTGWDIRSEGIVGRRTISQMASRIVLFICTGNTCRSPMAEALFRKMLCERLHCSEEELLDRGYLVLSAGLATTPGMPASADSVALMQQEGIDLRSHQSQPATLELLSVADFIVTMTQSHKESIQSRFPEMGSRLRTLAADGGDVIDPFGGTRADYERCCVELRRHLTSLLPEIASRVS